MGTLVLAGATSGSTTLTPVDAVTTVLTLPSATATLATLGANTFTGNQSITGTLGVTGTSTLVAVNASGAYSSTVTGSVFTANTATTSSRYISIGNSGGSLFAGQESSTGGGVFTGATAYAAVLGTGGATALQLFTNDTLRLTVSSAGAVTIPGTLGVTGKITATAAGIDVPTSNLGMVSSGTYTPTLFNTSNIDASTAFVCQYIRVGNVVTVSGNVNIDFTSPGSTSLGMSLPIASNFANANELGGVASSGVTTLNILGILADTTNDRAQFDGLTAATINTAMRFSFTYLIV